MPLANILKQTVNTRNKIMKPRGQFFSQNTGIILELVLVFGVIFIIMGASFLTWLTSENKLTSKKIDGELALTIAEAGTDYYAWHLAHNESDYKDGNSSDTLNGNGNYGPYIHDYFNSSGEKIGEYSLEITPPAIGSSIVIINSTGNTTTSPSVKKTVESKMSKPSLAKYAVFADDVMRFGTGTEVFGPIHSKNGIRFDGIAHNLVSSDLTSYTDPDPPPHTHDAVHTHKSDESAVFLAGKQFPVTSPDFSALSMDLAQMKTEAQSNGLYFGPGGVQGYHLTLRTDDRIEVRRVTSLRSGCAGQPSWSVNNENSVNGSPFNLPSNRVIFVEDNAWIDGQINTAKIMIASAKFPELDSSNTTVTINNDLLYTNYDGQDIIGIIAQKDIHVGLFSEDNLQIDGALIAKNGRVGRPNYNSSACGTNRFRNTITLNGMLATRKRYGFTWINSLGNRVSGYETRNINYDSDLLFNQPPFFPTSGDYERLSWEEK